MPDQPGSPSPADRRPGDAADPESLASALVALQDAVDELSRTAAATVSDTAHASPAPLPGTVTPPPAEPQPGGTGRPDEGMDEGMDERDLYVQSLERRGALVDVDASEAGEVDWASLPPAVTHVRFRDGRVQRIGFT